MTMASPGNIGGGAAAGYGYPITQGLLSAMSAPQSGGTNWTQVALGLAGNPHAGPYAASDGALPSGYGGSSGTAGQSGTAGTSGGSNLGTDAVGLLGELAKNPSVLKNGFGLVKSGVQAVNSLFSPSMDSALGLTSANSTIPALTGSQMFPVSTSAISSAANSAGSSAASELANLWGGSGGAASASGLLAPLTASQMLPVSTGAISSAANAAGASAAQELANAGYGSATSAGAAGASSAGSGLAGDATTALGALGAGYGLYNTVKNYQSGATGTDALNGAETGASIGTMVLPGVGTVVGGLLGGAAGALSSAFGGGRNDPETLNWNTLAQAQGTNPNSNLMASLNPSQAYQSLAGIMDAKNNSIGHSTNLELHFGRAGEQNLMDQMASQINGAVSSGQLAKGATAAQAYQQVVEPWLQQSGAYVPANAIISSNGTQNNGMVDNLLTQLIGQWQSGALTPGSQVGVSGQTIAGLPAYAGATSAPATTAARTQTASATPEQRRGLLGAPSRMRLLA